MNIFDLIAQGFNVEIKQELDGDAVIICTKDKISHSLQLKRQDLIDYNGGAVSSPIFEENVCKNIWNRHQVAYDPKITERGLRASMIPILEQASFEFPSRWTEKSLKSK